MGVSLGGTQERDQGLGMGERVVTHGFAHLTAEDVARSPYKVRQMDPHLDWRGNEGLPPTDIEDHPEPAIDFDKRRLSYDIVVDAAKAAHHAQLIRDADRKMAEREDDYLASAESGRGHLRAWLSAPLSLIRF